MNQQYEYHNRAGRNQIISMEMKWDNANTTAFLIPLHRPENIMLSTILDRTQKSKLSHHPEILKP